MPDKKQQNSPHPTQKWSQYVSEHSHALDLEPGLFILKDPKAIAHSLKQAAETSTHRKINPFRSAMSMLNFYINRAGKNLPDDQRQTLEKAKDELRKLYRK